MKKFYFMSNGKRLCGVIRKRQKSSMILVIHGFTSNKNGRTMKYIGSRLANQNYALMGIDLFGHGERHGIKVGRNEAVYYCEFPNHPKRHLIAQFHCNHLSGKCLAEYGEKPIYNFVLSRTQNQLDIQKQIKEIIKRKLI